MLPVLHQTSPLRLVNPPLPPPVEIEISVFSQTCQRLIAQEISFELNKGRTNNQLADLGRESATARAAQIPRGQSSLAIVRSATQLNLSWSLIETASQPRVKATNTPAATP